MRLLGAATAALLPLGASAADPQAGPRQEQAAAPARQPCKSDPYLHRAERSGPLTARRLGDLPAGNLVLTVMREVGGCQQPVIVRYGIGGDVDREAKRPPGRR